MRNDTPRQIIRSRSTMSYAFEAAVRAVIARGAQATQAARDVALVVASALDLNKGRKVPTWTVTKKELRR